LYKTAFSGNLLCEAIARFENFASPAPGWRFASPRIFCIRKAEESSFRLASFFRKASYSVPLPHYDFCHS